MARYITSSISYSTTLLLVLNLFVSQGHAANETSTNSSSPEYDDRIIDGRPVKPGEVPYQISLILDGYHYCGASLVVSPRTGLQFGITAAHCVVDHDTGMMIAYPEQYRVRAGNLSRNRGQKRRVAQFIPHELYGSDAGKFDIALIFFHGNFELNEQHLFPVAIPNSKKHNRIDDVFVSGWGQTIEDNPWESDSLQIVKLPVVSNQECNWIYQQLHPEYLGPRIVDTNQLCAGNRKGGKDSCQGDSGGPAVAKFKNDTVLVGVVSYGFGCARPKIPAVYTRVYSFREWIWRNVRRYELYTDYRPEPSQHGNVTTTTTTNKPT